MPNYIAKRFVLQGEVQGVGCRAQVQEVVEKIGHISGYVRNLPSGAVEVCVKGPDWRLADLEEWLRSRLHPPVRIERLLAEAMPIDFAPTGFVIKRD